MSSRLGRRVIHFANLPIKLQLPKTLTNITEISLRTIQSATKIEIKRVLESLYGFQVDKVRTLNMDGKQKKRGGLLIAKPDYKKAYVTLRTPLELSRDVFPVRVIEEEKKRVGGLAAKGGGTSFVEDDEAGERRRHWLDGAERGDKALRNDNRRGKWSGVGGGRDGNGSEKGMLKFPWSSFRGGGGRDGNGKGKGVSKFPWSSMHEGGGGGR